MQTHRIWLVKAAPTHSHSPDLLTLTGSSCGHCFSGTSLSWSRAAPGESSPPSSSCRSTSRSEDMTVLYNSTHRDLTNAQRYTSMSRRVTGQGLTGQLYDYHHWFASFESFAINQGRNILHFYYYDFKCFSAHCKQNKKK